ncbi:MAG: hypothetical protein JSV88_25565 [Candidatus Aminicenantes bacterium]|nr:MAG: hypothetical protein JSV88_25565 [Candidatus Aminicenantes bacterium]
MSRKQEFAIAVEDFLSTLENLYCKGILLEKDFFANGYETDGTDPIADVDLENFGYTADDFQAAASTIVQFIKLMSNQEVTQGDYLAKIAKIKRKFKR